MLVCPVYLSVLTHHLSITFARCVNNEDIFCTFSLYQLCLRGKTGEEGCRYVPHLQRFHFCRLEYYLCLVGPDKGAKCLRRLFAWVDRDKVFSHLRISQRAVRTSLEKQKDPGRPIASRWGRGVRTSICKETYSQMKISKGEWGTDPLSISCGSAHDICISFSW